jgi:hypothetical protein
MTKIIETNLQHELKSIENLHEVPMNFFNSIIEDKEKCLSDYNRKFEF